jgi:hypothetical protein
MMPEVEAVRYGCRSGLHLNSKMGLNLSSSLVFLLSNNIVSVACMGSSTARLTFAFLRDGRFFVILVCLRVALAFGGMMMGGCKTYKKNIRSSPGA